MPTKADITNSINTITDGGNNTANKVRTVLTGLLNFTENPAPVVIPPIPVVNYILLSNGPTAISSTPAGATLAYTIKGIKTQLFNMNIKLGFTSAVRSYQFLIPAAQKAEFNLIFPVSTAPLTFVVPVEIGSTRTYKSWNLQISLSTALDKLEIVLTPSGSTADSLLNTKINTIIPLLAK